MCRRCLIALVLFVLASSPAVAKSKTSAALAAANAAKAGFSERNQPEARSAEGVGVANRSVKAVIAAIGQNGGLALETFDGDWLGTVDPLAIPELIAQDKTRFGGRKRLEASDLAVGQRLKIVFRGNGSEILKAKVLRERSS